MNDEFSDSAAFTQYSLLMKLVVDFSQLLEGNDATCTASQIMYDWLILNS